LQKTELLVTVITNSIASKHGGHADHDAGINHKHHVPEKHFKELHADLSKKFGQSGDSRGMSGPGHTARHEWHANGSLIVLHRPGTLDKHTGKESHATVIVHQRDKFTKQDSHQHKMAQKRALATPEKRIARDKKEDQKTANWSEKMHAKVKSPHQVLSDLHNKLTSHPHGDGSEPVKKRTLH
jgi:hypothetical protein